jgi:hypothetical protein
MRKLSVLKTEGFFSCCAIGQKYLLNAISSNKLLGIFLTSKLYEIINKFNLVITFKIAPYDT